MEEPRARARDVDTLTAVREERQLLIVVLAAILVTLLIVTRPLFCAFIVLLLCLNCS